MNSFLLEAKLSLSYHVALMAGIIPTEEATKLMDLLKEQEAATVASNLMEEGYKVGAIVLALCSQEMRVEVIQVLPKKDKVRFVQAMSRLVQPPDFVLETLRETLESRFPKKESSA